MKKYVSVIAAFSLVAGVAGAASALEFTMSGRYMLEGYYLDNADGQGFNPYDDELSSDAAWVHTFQVKPTMQVNDKIKFKADIRLAKDQDWGSQDDLGTSDGGNVNVKKLYMEYASPIGKIRMGRTPAGAWAGDFLSSGGHADRIMWWPGFVAKPLSFYVFLQKSTEGDWYDGDSDSDNDLYEAGLDYKAENMLLKIGYDYYDYASKNDDPVLANRYEVNRHRIKGYGDMTFGSIYLETEFSYDWGDIDYDVNANDEDIDTFAFMVDVGTRMDKLDVGLMYFYASGDDDPSDDDNNAALDGWAHDGIGDDFNPYYILTGDHTGMLGSDEYPDDRNMAAAGVHCIGMYSNYLVTEKLTLRGALAYAMADRELDDVDDEYGWEIDLGATYKLLDNLSYELRAGYFDTGDFFEDMDAASDADDLLLLSHHLTLTF